MYTQDMASSEGHLQQAAAHAAAQAAHADGAAAAAAAADLLDLSVGGVDGGGAAGAPAAAAVAALEDLLGGGGGSPAPAEAAAAQAAAPPPLMDLLGGSPAPGQPAAPVPDTATAAVTLTFPPVQAYRHERTGVSITFAFMKPPGAEDLTEVTATYVNPGPTPVTQFNLQVRILVMGCRVEG